jgi:hypothetical protein
MNIFNKSIVAKQVASDLYRGLIGLALILFMLSWTSDLESLTANLHIIGLQIAFSIATALLSHVTRRLLFPYLDLQELVIAARGQPMASAIVFLSVCMVLSTMIISASAFISN